MSTSLKELTREELENRIVMAEEVIFKNCTCEKGCEEWECPAWVTRQALRGESTNKCWMCDEPILGVFDHYMRYYCKQCAEHDNIPICKNCGVPAGHLSMYNTLEAEEFNCPVCGDSVEREEEL